MQYGGSGGYPDSQRLRTAGLASRGGERGRVGALPDILWRASGVTTRPGSGLRLTVRHVDLPQHSGPQGVPPLAQQRAQTRLSRSEPTGKPLQYLPPSAQRRSSLRDTPRLLSRQKSSSGRHPLSPSSSTAPKATRTMLPPLPTSPSPQCEEPAEQLDGGERESTDSERESSSLEDSDEEIFSEEEEGEKTPASRPGFESEAEQSTHVFDVPFSAVSSLSSAFPATLLQDHLQLDMERFAAAVLPSGLSPRVNNIVRAFTIHGPLDHDLLSRALNSVASLHPVLCGHFQRASDRLYMQLPAPGPVSVTLDSPIVGHEKQDALITNARRKPFPLPLRSDLVATGDGSEGEKVISIVSLASKNSSDDSEGKPLRLRPLPSAGKKAVTFGQVTDLQSETEEKSVSRALPSLSGHTHKEEEPRAALMRAKLVQESVRETTLVLSFPRIICDYWSSCLFVRQLAEAYAQLEKTSAASRRIEASRRKVASRFGHRQAKSRGTGTRPAVWPGGETYRPSLSAQLNFQQVALREKQLLKFVSREKHWAFWEGMLTAVIRRQRGPNRVKVVPPIRIPSGLGEKVPRVPRPQTSRLRPLTGRGRPQTGRRLMEAAGGRGSLTGPKTEFHFLKFEEEVCERVCQALSEEVRGSGVGAGHLLSLVCLGVYVLLLGRCCRGWGEEEEEGKGAERERPAAPRVARDPLQHYQRAPRLAAVRVPAPSPPSPPSPRRSQRARMAGRLDLGSFLVGVEVSLRQSHPTLTQSLFGPLSTDVGVRVNLSSSETFLDLVLALGKTLQSVRNHHHFPFSTVTDELGVPPVLPVRFSYLHRSDIIQLSDPAHFYFPETAVGVKGHGLARLGSACYLSPLCTRLDDSRHLELCLWEGSDSESVGGVFIFQPLVLQRDLVEGLARELTKLMAVVARDPTVPLSQLSSHNLSPPFFHSRSHRPTHHR